MRNPKLKKMNQKIYLQRALTVNIKLMASLLYTLHKEFPAYFTRPKMREYIEAHADTVEMLRCGEDKELRQYKVAQMLKECEYIGYSTSEMILKRFRERDSANEQYYRDNKSLYEDNILLMLLTLHYDFKFGRKRMTQLVLKWGCIEYPDVIEWLADYVDAHLADTDLELYKAVDDLNKMRKKKEPAASLREELDAKRHLEALKAYQDDIMKGC